MGMVRSTLLLYHQDAQYRWIASTEETSTARVGCSLIDNQSFRQGHARLIRLAAKDLRIALLVGSTSCDEQRFGFKRSKLYKQLIWKAGVSLALVVFNSCRP
jgi:hypothetical protein